MATHIPAGSDVQPRELAELLKTVGDAILAQDREMAAILHDAQRRLEALTWNRYARRLGRESARRAFVRRHRAGLGVRHDA